MMGKLFAAAAIAAATLATSPAAFAGSVVVNYGDLNLETEAGQATLDGRINRAARDACEISSGRRTLVQTTADQACISAAKENAKLRVAMMRKNTRVGG